MGKFINLTGQKFGKLIVKFFSHTDNRKQSYWTCECDCGNKTTVRGSELKNGTYISCKECGNKRGADKLRTTNRKYNIFEKKNEYYIGYTLKDEIFYFDADDFEKIKQFCWHKTKTGYVATNIRSVDGKKKTLKLHHLILNEKGIDHINGNKMDNRKSNLQICTQQKNIMKKFMQSNNTSGITGISWNKYRHYYHAYITINNKRINLGYFQYKDFKKAITCRLIAEKKYFGEFAPQQHLFNQYGIK